MEVVRHALSPELLNRIDDMVVFNRLQREDMDRIAEMGIQEIADRLERGQNMTLDVSPTAVDCIAERGYDVRYGARPLKRTLNKELLNPLSRLVLEGGVIDGDNVQVVTRGEAEELPDNKFGWVCSNMQSSDKNDVVILRNHPIKPRDENDDNWNDDDEWLLEGDDSKARSG